MEEEIKDLEKAFSEDAVKADSLGGLEFLKTKYLGRKGLLSEYFQRLSAFEAARRPYVGQALNAVKEKVTRRIQELEKMLLQAQAKAEKTALDISLPGIFFRLGGEHILSRTTKEICFIFEKLGFAVVEGPEIETEYYNFRALNIPEDHPATEAFHTFYLESPPPAVHSPQKRAKNRGLSTVAYRLLLRSQTSTVQVRVMEKHKPPLRIISPGKVYRPDATDASHSFMFHQIEGFAVDTGVRFSDLKGTLFAFARKFFGQGIKIRFRPHYFPFTEPSVEVDISCIICKSNQPALARETTGRPGKPARPGRAERAGVTSSQKKQCSVCKGKGWLEILGAGMIHPHVFRAVGYDTKKYTGFAFGLGVERIAMLKYGIDDIRLFFENDLRFLQQF